MAKKGSGGAGGAHLASGYISLSVKYASAMGQIASDFDAVDKRAKATGDSITKNLVAGAEKAKAQVQELASAYEAQRAKVEALKATFQGLQAVRERLNAAEKAYNDAFHADQERKKTYIRNEIQLNEQLNAARAKARSQGIAKDQIENTAGVKAAQAAIAANDARRKKDVQDLTRLEKELQAARSSVKSGAAAKVQQELTAEVAKGKEMYVAYGNAVSDAARKQQLANTTITQASADMSKHRSIGMRIAQAIAGPFAPQLQQAGVKGANAFREAFNRHMAGAKTDSTHHGRNIASGLLMGLTPQFLTAAGAGLAIGAAFKSGFERLENIDTAKLKLEALGYSAEQVTATTDAAMNSVVGTAYSFSDAMNAATVAMAAGIKPGEQLQKHLTMIADAAALTGEDYGTMAETINRVTQYGVLSQREIRPLVSKNIPIVQWLKEYYQKQTGGQNVTDADIREMITKKMISAEVFEEVMTQHLNGMAKELGRKTVKGAFSNMWVQVGKVTASMIEPIFGSIPGAINKVADTLSRWSEQIKPIMGNAVEWIKKQWATIGPALGRAVDWIKQTWTELWPHVWFYIDKFVTMWREMWPQLMTHVQPLVGAFRRLWDALWPIVKPFVALAGMIAYEFIKHLPAIAQFATNLINWLATAVDWLRTKFWPWLKDSWKKFTEDVTGAWNTVKTFSEKVIGFFDNIKTRTQKTWDWLTDKFKWMKDNIPGLTTLLKALGLTGPDVALASSSRPMGNVPMPAGLHDTEGAVSGPQARWTAAQVMQRFPNITSVGGARKSGTAANTHDVGNSIDIPITDKAEGDRINAWLKANAGPLGIEYTIWRDRGVNLKDNPSGRAGSEFTQGGHQDHIDVHFDGNVALSSAGLDLKTPLEVAFAKAGIDPALFPVLTGFAKAEGNNPSGVPTLGFKDSQAGGSDLDSHARALAKQLRDRRSVAGPFPANGTPEEQAAWIAKVVGQAGVQGDIHGGNQPPRQAYIDSIVSNMPRRRVSMPVANMAFETPYIDVLNGGGQQVNPLWAPMAALSPEQMATVLTTPPASAAAQPGVPWEPGSQPFPSTGGNPIDIFQGSPNPIALNPPVAHGLPGIGEQPDLKGSFWERYIKNDPLMPQWMKEFLKPRTVSILPNTEMPGHEAFDSVITNDFGWPVSPLTPNDAGAGRTAANQYLHRGITGPKGTKDDPVIVQDPNVGDNTDKVAENTDPSNLPEPAEPLTPGGGIGQSAGAGLGITTDEDGNLVDSNGNPVKDAVTGLGDVASKAFSDQFAGTPFSDPTQWPATQSVGALLKFFGGLLTGDLGGGLGAFFPGGGSGKKPTDKQVRHFNDALRKKDAAIDKAQKELDEINAKPFMYSDEEIQAARDKVDELKSDRETLIADAQDSGINTGTAGGGGGWGPPQPFGQFNIGSPPPAPGGPEGGGAVQPGGGWLGNGLPTGLIPSPDQVVPEPAGAGAPGPAGPNVNINNNIQTYDETAARDAQARADNTTLNSPMLNLPKPPG